MNISPILFSQNFSKIFSKHTKLHHFKKNSRGNMLQNPPSKRVASIATRKYPHFSKIF